MADAEASEKAAVDAAVAAAREEALGDQQGALAAAVEAAQAGAAASVESARAEAAAAAEAAQATLETSQVRADLLQSHLHRPSISFNISFSLTHLRPISDPSSPRISPRASQANVATLSEQLEMEQASAAALEEARAAAEQALAAAEAERSALEAEKAALLEEVSRVQAEAATAAAAAGASAEAEEATAALAEQTTALAEEKAAVEEAKAAVEAELESSQGAVAALSSQLEQVRLP